MAHYPFWQIALLVFITCFRVALAAKGECVQPTIRREWRTLSDDERAEWITAVKVHINVLPVCSVLPHHFIYYI